MFDIFHCKLPYVCWLKTFIGLMKICSCTYILRIHEYCNLNSVMIILCSLSGLKTSAFDWLVYIACKKNSPMVWMNFETGSPHWIIALSLGCCACEGVSGASDVSTIHVVEIFINSSIFKAFLCWKSWFVYIQVKFCVQLFKNVH